MSASTIIKKHELRARRKAHIRKRVEGSQERPRLSLLWLRDPDSTQHNYGLGSENVRDALRSNDALLGRLRARLTELGLAASTRSSSAAYAI